MEKHEIYDVKFEGIWCNSDSVGFRIKWNSNIGFGQFDFLTKGNKPDKLFIDSEYMGKEFVKAVLNKMVDDAILDCDNT